MSNEARVTEGFGAGAGAYELGRPSYPSAVLEFLAGLVPVGPRSLVLDLGAGTGKFTRLLVPTGAQVVAIELVPAMLGELAAGVTGAHPVNGDARALPIRDAAVDLAAAATAFHWFADDPATAELARVIRAGGVFAIVSNQRDLLGTFGAAYEAILARTRPGPSSAGGGSASPSVLERSGQFVAAAEFRTTHVHAMDLEQLLQLTMSMSHISTRAEAEKRAIAEEVGALVGPDRQAPLEYHTKVTAFRRR